MNIPSFRLSAIALALIITAPAFAEGEAAADDGTGPYIGITAANDMVDIGITPVDDATSAGILLGYNFAQGVGIELATGGGDHDLTAFPGCVMENTTVAVYGALRTPGKVYFKGKIGMLNEELVSSGICGGITGDDTGMSYGLGGGVRIGNAGIEVEYTQIEADVSRLSATLLVNF